MEVRVVVVWLAVLAVLAAATAATAAYEEERGAIEAPTNASLPLSTLVQAGSGQEKSLMWEVLMLPSHFLAFCKNTFKKPTEKWAFATTVASIGGGFLSGMLMSMRIDSIDPTLGQTPGSSVSMKVIYTLRYIAIVMAKLLVLGLTITSVWVLFVAFSKSRALFPSLVASGVATSATSTSGAKHFGSPHLVSLNIAEMYNAAACSVVAQDCANLNRHPCDHPEFGSNHPSLCGWCKDGFTALSPSPGLSNCGTTAATPQLSSCQALHRLEGETSLFRNHFCGECEAGKAGTQLAPSLSPCNGEVAQTCSAVDNAQCEALNRKRCAEGGVVEGREVCGGCEDSFTTRFVGVKGMAGMAACLPSSGGVAEYKDTAYCHSATGGNKRCSGLGDLDPTDADHVLLCTELGSSWVDCTTVSSISTEAARKCRTELSREDDNGRGMEGGCGECLPGKVGSPGPTVANDCVDLPSGSLAVDTGLHMSGVPLSTAKGATAAWWDHFAIATAANPRGLPFSELTGRSVVDYEWRATAFPTRADAFPFWKAFPFAKETPIVVEGVTKYNGEPATEPCTDDSESTACRYPMVVVRFPLQAPSYHVNPTGVYTVPTQGDQTFTAANRVDTTYPSLFHKLDVSTGEWKVSGLFPVHTGKECDEPLTVSVTSANKASTVTYKVHAVMDDGTPCYNRDVLRAVYA